MTGRMSLQPTPRSRRRGNAAVLCLLGLFVLVLHFWSASQPGGWGPVESKPPGMYGLLTEAFAAGQMHLKVDPPAELLQLPDPYDPVANARYRLHDATLFNGHYYLYFGPSPVLALMLPWRLLFGNYLTEAFAIAVFTSVGFLATALLLVRLARRHFPHLPAGALPVAILAAGLGNMVLTLLQWPAFYQVPIAGAFAAVMVALLLLDQALASRFPAPGLAAAALAYGLAMAARPNYVLGAGMVFLPALAWLTLRPGRPERFFSLRTPTLLAAVFGPLAAVGGALLLYNYVRFGSLSEFGVKYQLASPSMLHTSPLFLAGFGDNLYQYFFATARFGPYFPFFSGGEQGLIGVAWGIPLLWLVLPALVAFWSRRLAERGRLGVMLTTVVLLAGCNLIMVCVYFSRVERYVVDFYPAFTLAGALAWFALAAAGGRWLRLGFGLTGGLAALVMIGMNLAICAARFASPAQLQPLGRMLNEPAALFEHLTGREPGSRMLKVIFPENPPARPEPLISTGIWRSQADVVYVEYPDAAHIRLGFFHVGMGGPKTEPIPVAAGSEHSIQVSFGGLLPTELHPVYRGWRPRSVLVARRTVRVHFDGVEVLRTAEESFPTRPADLRFGDAGWEYDFVTQRFSGRIVSVTTRPLIESDYAEPPVPPEGPLELQVVLPFGHAWKNEPLVATGTGSKNDLIYLIFGEPGQIKLALNHHGFGGPISEFVTFDPGQKHTIVLSMGNLAGAEPGRLIATFDGIGMLDGPHEFYPTRPEQIAFGSNPSGAGSAGPSFSGRLEAVRTIPVEAVPRPSTDRNFGALRVEARFPEKPAYPTEPLVVTGVTGAGDFLYVRYLGDGRVRFGFDHWGFEGGEGEPVTLEPGRAHTVDLTMDSLYEPTDQNAAARRNRVEVRLDGRVVLALESPTHPSAARDILIGENRIGGSTCGPRFSGTMKAVLRQSP